jgi:uncharacterized protein YfiM (DUF2279 family)
MRWAPWLIGLVILGLSGLAYAGALSAGPVAMVFAEVRGLDKALHFLLFGSLSAAGVMWARARDGERWTWRATAWIGFTISLAGADELSQLLSPRRSADPWDFAADVSGILVAPLIVLALARTRGRATRTSCG